MISCQQYDYIEIVCLYGYQVALTKLNGEILQGRALTTGIDEHKQEYVLLATAQGEVKVLLNELANMVVKTANPHVNEVIFHG